MYIVHLATSIHCKRQRLVDKWSLFMFGIMAGNDGLELMRDAHAPGVPSGAISGTILDNVFATLISFFFLVS